MLVIAALSWGHSPACGTPTVSFQPSLNTTTTPATDYPPGVELAGLAYLEACSVVLSRVVWDRETWRTRCDVLVHEAGHLTLPYGDLHHEVDAMSPNHRFRLCKRWARYRDRWL